MNITRHLLITAMGTAMLIGTSSVYAAIGAGQTQALQSQLNLAANAIAQAVNYEKANWDKSGSSADIGTAGGFASLATEIEQSKYLTTITLNDDTGVIVLTYATTNDVNRNLRGMVVTITPKYLAEDDTETAYTDRPGAGFSKSIHTYTCAINNATAAVNIQTFSALGRTTNLIGATVVSAKDLEGKVLPNVFANKCSGVTITLV